MAGVPLSQSAFPSALPPERLRTVCDPGRFGFDTTETLEAHPGGLGQERAMEALRFGLAMGQDGYNVFVLGEEGCGKHAITLRLLREHAATLPAPPDLCYVHNFDEPLHPKLLTMPAGRGEIFRTDMRAFAHESNGRQAVLLHLLNELRVRYADLPDVLAFFDALENDADVPDTPFLRYQVGLLTDHAGTDGAPVVFEGNPGYGNLVGRIGHVLHQGVQMSHVGLIRAGALHRANGGYLVVDAESLFAQPHAWEGLKRALRSGEIQIEPPAGTDWQVTPILSPQPVPCSLKIIMIGSREDYYTLMEHDPAFAGLFRVTADFSDDLPRTPENETGYAKLLALLARTDGLLPLDRVAVARMLEEGARIADDAGRLSLQTRRLSGLMREADHYARARCAACAGRADIEAALAARTRRVSLYPERVRESMLDGETLIATSGSRAGQVNALVVIELAGERFGHPARVSATVRLGDGDVVDIERESNLGGEIHSKGVMILSAFLASRYARNQPLSLSASLVFEQSYAQVEGDSASLAELCALLSALTRLPIDQRLAVTGSVNQFGEVQVIGGVNEKIEGFFDLCAARGLDGSHGVVIPAASVRHLMLREDVVEAARAGRFHVFPVNTVDEAMSILTGIPAGEADGRGLMPKGSINDKVTRALADMTLARHAHADGHGGAGRGSRGYR